jgi:hypothetical protein
MNQMKRLEFCVQEAEFNLTETSTATNLVPYVFGTCGKISQV